MKYIQQTNMHYYSRGPLRYVKNPQKPLFHSSLLLMEKTARIQCIYPSSHSLSFRSGKRREFNVFTPPPTLFPVRL